MDPSFFTPGRRDGRTGRAEQGQGGRRGMGRAGPGRLGTANRRRREPSERSRRRAARESRRPALLAAGSLGRPDGGTAAQGHRGEATERGG
jgi:hypothetical protein